MHLIAPVHPSVRQFVCALTAVDIRGSALLSAANSIRSHHQSTVFVCVSVIRRRIIRYTDKGADVVDRLLIFLGEKVASR